MEGVLQERGGGAGGGGKIADVGEFTGELEFFFGVGGVAGGGTGGLLFGVGAVGFEGGFDGSEFGHGPCNTGIFDGAEGDGDENAGEEEDDGDDHHQLDEGEAAAGHQSAGSGRTRR